MDKDLHILSIAPYCIVPPSSGGQLSIVFPQHYLGMLHDVHVISTADNAAEHKYSFMLHRIFPVSAKRYLPRYKLGEIIKLSHKHHIDYIYCDHPYMAPTAIALSKKLGIPWFLRNQNIESERFRQLGKKWWPFMYLFERYVMHKASGLLFITPQEMEWAIHHYNTDKTKCHFIPYGTIAETRPQGHKDAKMAMAKELQTNPDKPWLYFLGALDYLPNIEAINFILNEIMPRLNKKEIDYHIFIAGKNLPPDLKEKIDKTLCITYTGFIPDLDIFLKACDIMLNPVLTGGGIKTKAVEALGYNKIVISSLSGAAGLEADACGQNLFISTDNDWDCFIDNIIRAIDIQPAIPQKFYDIYYWGNIARKITGIMKATDKR